MTLPLPYPHRRLTGLLVGLLLATLAVPTPAASVQTADGGRWLVGMDDSLGGCFALAEFDGGAFLRVGFADDPADLYLLIGDADWGAVEADTLYPIGLQFDTGPLQDLDPPWTGEAMGTRLDDGTGALYLHLHDALDMKAVFLDALARRQRLTVTHAGTAIANLSLRGSRVAIDDVLACQRRRVRPDLVE